MVAPNPEFRRIERLPPYVFNIVNELKAAARARGEDIIDFGMGNPDQPTPAHIVDKLIEVSERRTTHRYSVSRGIPRLRRAICNWYGSRYDVSLDPETEAIVTIGSKEGLAHLALATVGPAIDELEMEYSRQTALRIANPADEANEKALEESEGNLLELCSNKLY